MELSTVDTATEALNQAWQAASQDLYQAQQDGGADATSTTADTGTGTTENGSEDVTDVEFEEVDDSK